MITYFVVFAGARSSRLYFRSCLQLRSGVFCFENRLAAWYGGVARALHFCGVGLPNKFNTSLSFCKIFGIMEQTLEMIWGR